MFVVHSLYLWLLCLPANTEQLGVLTQHFIDSKNSVKFDIYKKQ